MDLGPHLGFSGLLNGRESVPVGNKKGTGENMTRFPIGRKI